MNPAFCTPLLSSAAQRFDVNQKEKLLESIPLITTAVATIRQILPPSPLASNTKRNPRKSTLCVQRPWPILPLLIMIITRYRHSRGDCTIKQCVSIPLLVECNRRVPVNWFGGDSPLYLFLSKGNGTESLEERLCPSSAPNCASRSASWPQTWRHRWACPGHRFPCRALKEPGPGGRRP